MRDLRVAHGRAQEASMRALARVRTVAPSADV